MVSVILLLGVPRAQIDEAENLRVLERGRLRALVDADIKAADPLHADDFQLVNPVAETSTKSGYLGAVASGQVDYRVWDAGPIDVRIHGEAAIMRYPSNLHVIVGGRDLGLRAHWHTDFYEKRGGRWQIVWSHASARQ